jgi:hypothetical protein
MSLDSHSALILRSRAQRGVSKDGPELRAAWFETRGFVALLTMRAEQSGAVRSSLPAKAWSAAR